MAHLANVEPSYEATADASGGRERPARRAGDHGTPPRPGTRQADVIAEEQRGRGCHQHTHPQLDVLGAHDPQDLRARPYAEEGRGQEYEHHTAVDLLPRVPSTAMSAATGPGS